MKHSLLIIAILFNVLFEYEARSLDTFWEDAPVIYDNSESSTVSLIAPLNDVSLGIQHLFKSGLISLRKFLNEIENANGMEKRSCFDEGPEAKLDDGSVIEGTDISENKCSYIVQTDLHFIESEVKQVMEDIGLVMDKIEETSPNEHWRSLKSYLKEGYSNLRSLQQNTLEQMEYIKNEQKESNLYQTEFQKLFLESQNRLFTIVTNRRTFFKNLLQLPSRYNLDIDIKVLFDESLTELLKLKEETAEELFNETAVFLQALYSLITAQFYKSDLLDNNNNWLLLSATWRDAINVKITVDNMMHKLKKRILDSVSFMEIQYNSSFDGYINAFGAFYSEIQNELEIICEYAIIGYWKLNDYAIYGYNIKVSTSFDTKYEASLTDVVELFSDTGYNVPVEIQNYKNVELGALQMVNVECNLNGFEHQIESSTDNDSYSVQDNLETINKKTGKSLLELLSLVLQEVNNKDSSQGDNMKLNAEVVSYELSSTIDTFKFALEKMHSCILEFKYSLKIKYGPNANQNREILETINRDTDYKLNILFAYLVGPLRQAKYFIKHFNTAKYTDYDAILTDKDKISLSDRDTISLANIVDNTAGYDDISIFNDNKSGSKHSAVNTNSKLFIQSDNDSIDAIMETGNHALGQLVDSDGDGYSISLSETQNEEHESNYQSDVTEIIVGANDGNNNDDEVHIKTSKDTEEESSIMTTVTNLIINNNHKSEENDSNDTEEHVEGEEHKDNDDDDDDVVTVVATIATIEKNFVHSIMNTFISGKKDAVEEIVGVANANQCKPSSDSANAGKDSDNEVVTVCTSENEQETTNTVYTTITAVVSEDEADDLLALINSAAAVGETGLDILNDIITEDKQDGEIDVNSIHIDQDSSTSHKNEESSNLLHVSSNEDNAVNPDDKFSSSIEQRAKKQSAVENAKHHFEADFKFDGTDQPILPLNLQANENDSADKREEDDIELVIGSTGVTDYFLLLGFPEELNKVTFSDRSDHIPGMKFTSLDKKEEKDIISLIETVGTNFSDTYNRINEFLSGELEKYQSSDNPKLNYLVAYAKIIVYDVKSTKEDFNFVVSVLRSYTSQMMFYINLQCDSDSNSDKFSDATNDLYYNIMERLYILSAYTEISMSRGLVKEVDMENFCEYPLIHFSKHTISFFEHFQKEGYDIPDILLEAPSELVTKDTELGDIVRIREDYIAQVNYVMEKIYEIISTKLSTLYENHKSPYMHMVEKLFTDAYNVYKRIMGSVQSYIAHTEDIASGYKKHVRAYSLLMYGLFIEVTYKLENVIVSNAEIILRVENYISYYDKIEINKLLDLNEEV